MQGDYLQQIEERPLTGVGLRRLEAFLQRQGLRYDSGVEYTVLYYDSQGNIAATGSLQKNVLKCIAVAEECRGKGSPPRWSPPCGLRLFPGGSSTCFCSPSPKTRPCSRILAFIR